MIKNLLYISIFTALVVASWVGFSVYHNFTTTTITGDTSITITPIDDTFDQDTLQALAARTVIPVDLTAQSPLGKAVTKTKESSPSSQLTQNTNTQSVQDQEVPDGLEPTPILVRPLDQSVDNNSTSSGLPTP